jgi:hypothetical protein
LSGLAGKDAWQDFAQLCIFLRLAKEFDVWGTREQACRSSALDQSPDRLLAAIAVAKRPPVNIHADELIRDIGFHIAGELHGVVKCLFAMLETILDAILDGLGDLQAQSGTQRAAYGISAER